VGAKFIKPGGTDALDPEEILRSLEGTSGALIHDPLGKRRSDSRQFLELGGAGCVRVEFTRGLLGLSSGVGNGTWGRIDRGVRKALGFRIPFQHPALCFQRR